MPEGKTTEAEVRMWAFSITKDWKRNDHVPTTTADRVRWAKELVDWVRGHPAAFPDELLMTHTKHRINKSPECERMIRAMVEVMGRMTKTIDGRALVLSIDDTRMFALELLASILEIDDAH